MNKQRIFSVLRSPAHSLSTKLSLAILLMAVPIFIVSLGVLFNQSRHMIRAEAVGRANSVLGTTLQRIYRNITAIETATNSNIWLVTHHLQPDSIVALTHRIVRINSHIDGCSISAEPEIFPEYGRYFSAYSIRKPDGKMQTDSVHTVIEQEYEYFDRIWYKTPRALDGPCWVVYYDDVDSLDLVLDGMLASYGVPIRDDNNRFIGVISTDLSLLRLSKVVSSQEKPYSHSYFMMIGKDGRYFIHPDSTRLFTQTIFSGVDPVKQADVIALGHEMTAGQQGNMPVVINGESCLVCYQPVPGTSWSLALVCPDSDILEGYHQLTYIVLPLLGIGLLVILLLCYRAVGHAIHPINVLLSKTQSIAAGNMEMHIPSTKRKDAVGRLQNSFATMLQSLNFHMGSVRYTSELAKRRNEELVKATRLAREADRQKTAFLQNVTHQIRTPLNIIMGFTQILNSGCEELSEEEMKSITHAMDHNSKLLNRLVLMLFDSSDIGLSEELAEAAKHEHVSCNDVAREAIGYIKLHYPDLNIIFHTELSDDTCVFTNRVYLMRSLREVLYNAAKYSDGEHVSISVSQHQPDGQQPFIRYVVEDTGKGIDPINRERIFEFFTKVDDLSEGLGLGLPLSKRHAHTLGGDLILDENYHQGCRFILDIPQNPA